MSRLLICALAVFAGCTSPENTPDPESPASRGGNSGPPSLPPSSGMHPAGTAGPVVSRSAATRDPFLIPGDVLEISVYNEPDLKLEIRIPDGGSFSYPLIGQVEAAGLTPGSVEQGIRDRLAKDYLQNPQVTVNVKTFALRKVYVLGGVQKPNGYELLPNERITLLQIISVAGGITDKAYKEGVQIVRRNGKGEREVILLSLADVEGAIARGKAEADVELWPDDLVVIPSAARVVYVLGAVKEPGWFEIPADTRMTVSMAISRAGSYTKFASTGSLQVLRQVPGKDPQKISVSLDDIVGGRLDLDVVLQPGDVVWVPERGLF